MTKSQNSKQSKESRESPINKLNQELLKIELQYEMDVLSKFNEVINKSKLTPEMCADLLNEDRSQLGSTDHFSFYVEIIDNLYDRAKGQHENDIDNGDDIGFGFALIASVELYWSDKAYELKGLNKSKK